MIEEQLAADEKERRRALDPLGSFIVQAPAGSGKTALLTQRYLALLPRVAHPEEIVAITFTNKAAGEMRARVLKALAEARAPQPPEAPHERMSWELARAVLAHDRRRGWRLEENPSRLRVSTIDSLCAALTRQMPLAAGFGAPPTVVEDAYDLYVEAARATLAELESGQSWSAAVERLLRHLDNHLGVIEELIARMLEKRDQWLRHVADRRNPRIERRQLEAALGRLIAEALAEVRRAAPPELGGEVAALARYAAGNLVAAGAESALVTCRALDDWPGTRGEDLAMWLGIAELLLTRDGAWRRAVNKGVGFPAPGDGKQPAEAAQAKARVLKLLEQLADREALRFHLHRLRVLPAATYREEQWVILEALIELLPLAVAQLELVFRRRGTVDFTAVSQAALSALGEPEAPSDLALALDYRIRHILVDEFQDISLTQFELLERLTAGWEPGDGRTLFVVGDPMQSIYRFREAEVGLYLRAWREGIGQVRLAPVSLSVNFRSQQGIVEWVNAAFARVMPAIEDIATGAVAYRPSFARRAAGETPAVCVHALLEEDFAAEAEKVVALIETARREDPDGRIAILVRGRNHLAEIVPRLKQAGLRFLALDIEHLGHRQVVQDLLALTRALVHPADRVAWLALVRAPWCGLTLADLHALAGDDRESALWDLMREQVRLARLSEDGQRRLLALREVLQASLAERRRRSLRRWVEGTWLALGGPACVTDATDLKDAEVFFAALEELDEAGDLAGLERLAQRVAGLYARPDVAADDRLQIMTIHKAKGLEFDTVIVPGLGRRSPPERPQLLLWAERPRGQEASDLLFAPIRESGRPADEIYRFLQRLHAERDRHEDERLLYVAATRARRHLHLLGHTRLARGANGRLLLQPPASDSLLARLWPAVEEEFRRAAEAATAAAMPDTPVCLGEPQPALAAVQGLERLSAGWARPAPPPTLAWHGAPPPAEETPPAVVFEWAGETARHVGTVVHRMLLRIASEGIAAWDRARIERLSPAYRAALRQLGVAREELPEALERVRAALARALDDARGRWLLAAHEEAGSEYALSGVWRGRLVHVTLDRTFVDGGTRWIVDYKTSVHEGADLDAFLDRERSRYAPQLERYAAIFALRDTRPIRLGLYFPLLGGWREWEYAPKTTASKLSVV